MNVFQINTCIAFNQNVDNIQIAISDSFVQRCFIVHISFIDAGTIFKQDFHNVFLILLHSFVQWCFKLITLNININSSFDQALCPECHITLHNRMKFCFSFIVNCGIDVRFKLKSHDAFFPLIKVLFLLTKGNQTVDWIQFHPHGDLFCRILISCFTSCIHFRLLRIEIQRLQKPIFKR